MKFILRDPVLNSRDLQRLTLPCNNSTRKKNPLEKFHLNNHTIKYLNVNTTWLLASPNDLPKV